MVSTICCEEWFLVPKPWWPVSPPTHPLVLCRPPAGGRVIRILGTIQHLTNWRMLHRVLTWTPELWKKPLLTERCKDWTRLNSSNFYVVDDFYFFSSLVNRERKFGHRPPPPPAVRDERWVFMNLLGDLNFKFPVELVYNAFQISFVVVSFYFFVYSFY